MILHFYRDDDHNAGRQYPVLINNYSIEIHSGKELPE